ncbi:MAG: twin-arginine translocation signal domain-containing protein, partial [Gemmatimonadaceae bacterium]|nr:twin-arginine translocation signal domain-containing protein [Gemmatimonadaceae bacterium]
MSGDRHEASRNVDAAKTGVSRRAAITGLGAAAAAIAVGKPWTPTPLLASTPDWRADLAPPPAAG